MSKLLEFFLGSILIAVFTIAFLFFSAVHYLLRGGGVTDCAWQASAKAWLDGNGDGQFDLGEPPLSDVAIYVNDVKNQLINVSWPAITNEDGDVQLSVSIPQCTETALEVYALAPEGYRLTTRPSFEISPDLWPNLNRKRVYYFGFASIR